MVMLPSYGHCLGMVPRVTSKPFRQPDRGEYPNGAASWEKQGEKEAVGTFLQRDYMIHQRLKSNEDEATGVLSW